MATATIEEAITTAALEFTKGYLQEATKNLRIELKQEIRSYVDHALEDHEPGHYPNACYPNGDRHGQRWDASEEKILNEGLSRLIRGMAHNFGRSEEAIKLRIHKQRLLW